MGINPVREERLHDLARLGGVVAAVFVASYTGIALLDRGGGVAPIWIANAVLIYFVLRSPREQTAALLMAGIAARFCAGLVIGSTPLSALAFSLCNLVEIAIVALPLQALGAQHDFARTKSLTWFYVLAIGPGPIASGILAALYVHFARGDGFVEMLVNWYAADGLGLIVIVPILFTVRREAFARMFRRDLVVKSLLYISSVLVVIGINSALKAYPVAFLFFPAVIFLTFQRSFEGGAIGLALVAGYLIWPLFAGRPVGGLDGHSFRDQIIIVEIFIAVTGFSVVLVGAALEERRRLEAGLSAATARAQTAREEAIVAKDAAENANRMKSMFLATMSHELRTPLNAVIGFSQLMEAETFGPLGDEHYHEYTGLIQKAGRHLLDLINDILDMSKIEAGKFDLHRELIDIRLLVSDCVQMMRERAHQGGVVLEEILPHEPVKTCADPRAIKQILLNLLSNAVKFTPGGGRVTTRVVHDGARLALSVQDTGIGIPADQIYRLGNPFVQLRNSAGAAHEGTGLGLALVRSLAEMHGGALKIESVEGRGTTVTIDMPIEASESLAAA